MIKIRKNSKEYKLVERLVYWTSELFYNLERSPEDKEFSAKAASNISYCLIDMEKCGLHSDFYTKILQIGVDWKNCQENYLDTLLKDLKIDGDYLIVI